MPLKNPIARRAYQLDWERRNRKKNPEYYREKALRAAPKHRESTRNWAAANKERKKETNRAWLIRNRARVAARMRSWRKANPEKVKAINKICYLRNLKKDPACYRKLGKRWKEANPEKVKQASRKSYRKHHASRCKRAKAWRQAHPIQVLIFGQARRARKKAAIIEDCSAKIALLKRARFCHWCCCSLASGAATIDHVVPLARGGKHCNDNLVAACLSCNTSKNDSLVHEWTWKEAA